MYLTHLLLAADSMLLQPAVLYLLLVGVSQLLEVKSFGYHGVPLATLTCSYTFLTWWLLTAYYALAAIATWSVLLQVVMGTLFG